MRWLFVVALSIFTARLDRLRRERSLRVLIAWRVLQGFAGGMLIPTVFSAVFLLFPVRRQGSRPPSPASLAVLAPTVGPIVGGWITETYSWHWLFLINVVPGHRRRRRSRPALLPRERRRSARLRGLDARRAAS